MWMVYGLGILYDFVVYVCVSFFDACSFMDLSIFFSYHVCSTRALWYHQWQVFHVRQSGPWERRRLGVLAVFVGRHFLDAVPGFWIHKSWTGLSSSCASVLHLAQPERLRKDRIDHRTFGSEDLAHPGNDIKQYFNPCHSPLPNLDMHLNFPRNRNGSRE